jgi:hypothetical protein
VCLDVAAAAFQVTALRLVRMIAGTYAYAYDWHK